MYLHNSPLPCFLLHYFKEKITRSYVDNYMFYYLNHFVFQGPPKPVSDVTVVAVAAEQVMISFIVGENGGSQQTFHFVVRQTGSSNEMSINTDYVDPRKGSLQNFTLQNLQPEATYIASVHSVNLYGEDSSNLFQFTTRGKVFFFSFLQFSCHDLQHKSLI